MDKVRSLLEKLNNYNYDYLLLGPRSDSYHDKLVFYCGTGAILSVLISFGFKSHMRSTIMLGIGIPMGYLHRDLMKLIYNPTNVKALDALPTKIESKSEVKK